MAIDMRKVLGGAQPPRPRDGAEAEGYRNGAQSTQVADEALQTQLCGPDRKIIRLRDKHGIYLFLIEITAITKYLADADGGSRRILRSRPDCWS
jgi:hypothetical protein